MPDPMLWSATLFQERTRYEEPEKYGPVLAIVTDNVETEMTELRLYTPDPDRDLLIASVEPRIGFADRGLRITGWVSRSRGRDVEEQWSLSPFGGGPVAWRVEVRVEGEEEPFDVLDPATLIQDFTTTSKTGKRILVDELEGEDRWSDDSRAWEYALRIRTNHSKRWIIDPDVCKLLAWEIVVDGTTKHRGEMVPALLTVTHSKVPAARTLLGSSQ